MNGQAPQALLPESRLRPSRWTFLLKFLARRRGIDLGKVTLGRGRPWPNLKREDGTMDLGRIFLAPGTRLWAHMGASLSIGDGTVVDERAELIAWEGLTIGHNAYIGWDVLVMDTDLHAAPGKQLRNRPVRIGDNVTIGCRSILLKGVIIGNGAVVQPGSIVTRDVPDGGEARVRLAEPIRR